MDLAAIDPADASAAPGDKKATNAASDALAVRLAELQDILWARQQERLLVVLQGIDTSGKGGTVEHVFGAVNPAGLRVTSFKAPSETELARDYLWRVHANVPQGGEIGVFDRSHYEDVIAVRVFGLAARERHWRKRYDHINAFEQLLADEGTTIVKVLLHISKDEQKRRLEARLAEPAQALEVPAERPRRPASSGTTTRTPSRRRSSARPPSTRPGTSSPPTRSGTGTGRSPRSSPASSRAWTSTWPESPDDLTGVVID